MSKYVIECPSCGKSVLASNSLFAKKKIPCSCGYIIDLKTERLTSTVCPHCGNTVVYDAAKGEKATCPVCHNKINTLENRSILTEFTCPTCGCTHNVDKNAAHFECPLCGTDINVQERIEKERIKKQGIISVVKFEGDTNTIVWKHPVEDFNLGSQLIVHETQEAIFFRDGRALDLFGAGRYTLATQNLPKLENLYKLPSNTTDYFHSEVYFINTSTIMGVKWGTDSKVRFIDPESGLPIELGACGEFNIKVEDSRKLLLKVVGTTGVLSAADVINSEGGLTTRSISGKFRALVMNTVKSNLARSIREQAINILEIDEHMDVLSRHLQGLINVGLQEYGLILPEFYITTIITPDDDPNFKRLKQQHADLFLKINEQKINREEAKVAAEVLAAKTAGEANAMRIEGQAKADVYRMKAGAEADEMKMKGFSYQQQTAREIGVGAVTSGGGGPYPPGEGSSFVSDIIKAGVGLGVGVGVAGEVVNMTKEAVKPSTPIISTPQAGDTWECPKCHHTGNKGKFCEDCGEPKPVTDNTWECPKCHHTGNKGKFCEDCGEPKPVTDNTWECPKCHHTGNKGKFCDECGNPKTEVNNE